MPTIEEEIEEIEEEIRITPHHKGTEKHIGLLKAKIAKLRKELVKGKKKGRRALAIRKEGDGTVSIISKNPSRSAKLLTAVTNAKVRSTFKLYQGMILYNDAKIQTISIPRMDREMLSILKVSDLIIVFEGEDELIENLKSEKVKGPFLIIKLEKRDISAITAIKKKIYEALNLMRVYTRRKGILGGAMILKKGATVREVCENIHKDLKKNFKHALITGKSVKFTNQRVGANHVVEDGDVITIITNKG